MIKFSIIGIGRIVCAVEILLIKGFFMISDINIFIEIDFPIFLFSNNIEVLR